jgi:hypothetical protein
MKNIVILFLSLIIVSCSETDESTGLIFNQASYNTNRELWENNGVLDYTFSQEYFSSSVGGQSILTTIVKNSELDTIYSQSIEESVKQLTHYETIDDVFDFINYMAEYCNDNINSSNSSMNGANITVEYDEKYYYPTKISCSGYYPDGYVGGLDTEIFIADFKEN